MSVAAFIRQPWLPRWAVATAFVLFLGTAVAAAAPERNTTTTNSASSAGNASNTASASTSKERRIALVIGNARYPALPLTNPENDARVMATALRRLGFDVSEHVNLPVKEFRRVLRDFARRAQGQNGAAVFYYAGHGVQLGGRNYLLPVDINLRDQDEVRDEGVDIDELLLSRLEQSQSQVRIVILDACRDDPFSSKTRSARGGGLAEMAARGALIAYATAPGATAEDGPPGTNSVFTRHLAKEMLKENAEVEQMFKSVRVNVMRDTEQRQVPWVNTSMTTNFSFNPAKGPSPEDQARREDLARLQALLEQRDQQQKLLEQQLEQLSKRLASTPAASQPPGKDSANPAATATTAAAPASAARPAAAPPPDSKVATASDPAALAPRSAASMVPAAASDGLAATVASLTASPQSTAAVAAIAVIASPPVKAASTPSGGSTPPATGAAAKASEPRPTADRAASPSQQQPQQAKAQQPAATNAEAKPKSQSPPAKPARNPGRRHDADDDDDDAGGRPAPRLGLARAGGSSAVSRLAGSNAGHAGGDAAAATLAPRLPVARSAPLLSALAEPRAGGLGSLGARGSRSSERCVALSIRAQLGEAVGPSGLLYLKKECR